MMSIWVVLVLITLVQRSCCQTFDPGLPLSVNLYEEETTQKDLVDMICAPLADIKVIIHSIYPSGYCDTCFAVYQDPPGSEYKLRYLPSQGQAIYSDVSIYTLVLGCTTDDVIFDNHTLEVRIETNEPPYFASFTDSIGNIDAKTATKDTFIYEVTDVSDDEGDPIFYNLTVEPGSSANKYSIGLTDGKIRAAADLSSECRPTVLFIVTAQDNRNPPVGPKYITLTFTEYYRVPYISVLNKEITVSESLAVGDTVGPDDITAVTNAGIVNYVLTTFPPVLNFVIADTGFPRIIIDKKLNWEDRVNSIRITVTPQNGYCEAESYYLDVNVIDANDPPVMLPETITVWVYEHDIDFLPGFTVTDEDVIDSYTYSIVPGTDSDLFSINYQTGKITAVGYDVDGLTPNPTQVTLTIQVEDTKGPDIGNATLIINIQDSNDNPPVFGGERFEDTAEECATSQVFGGIPVDDPVDSTLNNNNVVTCLPNSNGNIFVLADCSFWLDQPLPAGSVSSLIVSAVDQGTIPGPMTAVKNATVVITFTPCTLTTPSTMAPTTQPPTTQPTTTTTPTPTLPGLNGLIPGSSSNGDDATSNIAWIIVACVFGCIALATAAFLISRFCLPNCNEGRSSRFKTGSAGQNRTNPQQNQPNQQNQNQYRSNTQKNMQKPVTPREVKPFEPKDGAEAYRKGAGDGPFNGQQKNVWHGMGQQPGKAFDL